MDDAVAKIVTTLLGGGPFGLLILFLGYSCWRLYNRNEELNKALYDVGREYVKNNETVVAALNRLSDLLKAGAPK